jgi:hypothetical protein
LAGSGTRWLAIGRSGLNRTCFEEAPLRIPTAVLCATLFAVPAQAQVTLNPKVGISLSDMKDATADVDTKGRLGYQAGVDLRVGSMLYLQPGIYLQQTGLEQEVAGGLTYNLDVRGIHIPVLVGLRGGSGLAGFRIVAGPALTLVQSVKDNAGLVTEDDLTTRRLGGMIGVGVDVIGLTVDLSGEFGMTKFFEQGSDNKLRTIRLSAGLRF